MIGRKIMAICDTEAGYACRLMEYLEEKRSLPYEIHAFTSADTLCDFAAGQEIGLLLVSETALNEQVRQIPAARRVVLTDEEETETAEELRLCKFQAAGRILQRVLAYSRGNAAPHPQPVRWRERRMLGVYAPAGGSEATLFAAALGQILSGDQDVLYLNLHSCSGLELLSGEICERTLSDLLYYYHREEDSLMEKLSGAVRHLGVLEYIPPVSEPSDLQEISGEEWTSFLGRLLKDGPYDTLLLELSDSVHDLPELLGLCERIYLPVQRDAVAQAAAEQFFETLRSSGRADLRQRMTVVRPPRPGSEEEVLLLASEGEAGRYVRRLLAGREEKHGSASETERGPDGAARRKRRAFRQRDPGSH